MFANRVRAVALAGAGGLARGQALRRDAELRAACRRQRPPGGWSRARVRPMHGGARGGQPRGPATSAARSSARGTAASPTGRPRRDPRQRQRPHRRGLEGAEPARHETDVRSSEASMKLANTAPGLGATPSERMRIHTVAASSRTIDICSPVARSSSRGSRARWGSASRSRPSACPAAGRRVRAGETCPSAGPTATAPPCQRGAEQQEEHRGRDDQALACPPAPG